jgi:hypothetical protein
MVLREMRNVAYVGHPVYQKTIAIVKRQYFWPSMEKEVDDYIVKCLECQKVKDENRRPNGFLQPFPIPEWKWKVVKIYFITKIPITVKQHDSIMVVVYKLTKATHFVPLNQTHKENNIT